MNEQQSNAIWGLNFLQEAKDVHDDITITGAYDPKQGVWVMQGQVQDGIIPNPSEFRLSRQSYRSTSRKYTYQSGRTGEAPNLDIQMDTGYATD